MLNPATPQDVADRWRPLSDQEQVNAQTFLEDAWRMAKRRVSTLEARITAGETDLLDETIRVLAQAVLRVMKNPDGKRQESIDDYSWTRDQALSAGLLYLTGDELSDLADPTAGVSRAFTVDTTPAGILVETDYPLSVTGQPDWLDWS